MSTNDYYPFGLNSVAQIVVLGLGLLGLISCDSTDQRYIVKSSDGTLIIEGFIENGMPAGIWKYYDQNGHLVRKAIYDRNSLATLEFYSNGNLIYLESYYDDVIQKRIAFGVEEAYEGGDTF